MKVAVLDDYQSIAAEMADWDRLPAGIAVTFYSDHLADEDALAYRLHDFDIVMGMRERTPFPRSLLERLPNLRCLITTGGRNASFDLYAATELGITVCGTPGAGEGPTELTWGLIIGLLRRIYDEQRTARQMGKWGIHVGTGLQGKTLALLGLGHIGSRVARVGSAFDMRVIAWSQNLTPERAAECGASPVDKDTLFAEGDVVSVHVRLSDRTRGLVGAREIGLMKPSAVLVNISRGPIVDEDALVSALQLRSIAGAALDTFDIEPLPAGHPFLAMDNVLITPHIGYVTDDGYRAFYGGVVDNIRAFAAGEPVRVINPAVLTASNRRQPLPPGARRPAPDEPATPAPSWTPDRVLLERAYRARYADPENAPRIILEILQQRIRDIEPDVDDYWEAAKRLGRKRGNRNIDGGYWSAMVFEEDHRLGRMQHNADDWEMEMEGLEHTLGLLTRDYP